MASRLGLQTELEFILGSQNVYFQPPENIKLSYPCIVYKKDAQDIKFANDLSYIHKTRYKVTVIDSNPDSLIGDRVMQLPMCTFDRHYTAENLNHDAYNLYY